MSLTTQFSVDIRELEKDLRSLGERAPSVMARSINRAGNTGRSAWSSAVSKDLGLTKRYVERDLKLDKATRTRPVFVATIQGKRLPLIAFNVSGPEPSRGRGRGVSWRIGKNPRVRERNAFIAVVGIGAHRGVFVRKGVSKRESVGAWGPNLPIKELRGPSIPHVFENYLPVFREAAEPALIKNLRHEITFARSREGA